MSNKLACINKYGKRKRFQNRFKRCKKSYVRKVFDEKIKNITIDIFKIIPHICYRRRKITTGLESNHLNIFLNVQIKLRELSYLIFSVNFNSDNFFCFAFFEFFKNIIEKLIHWLSTTDEDVVLVIINSFPILVNIIEKMRKNTTIRSRKRFRSINSLGHMYIEKLIKRFVQILSLFSTSVNVGTRVSCIFNMNVLTKIDGFNVEILYEAFSPQNLPFEHFDIEGNNSAIADTTSNVSQDLTTKFSEFKKNVIFSSKFSLIKFFKISSIKGIENKIYDKGWIYKRLEDESPAVRFEIFTMINDIFKSKKLYMSDLFVNRINDIIFDYFLDENIAIQTLISEMIVTISLIIPISTENISKIIPTINDCNTKTKSNLIRIASFGVFLESKGLIKLIVTLANSIEQLDEILFYNSIPSIVKNNLCIASEIINDLFGRYFKEKGFRRVILLIFTYWAIWNSPSIINKINPKLLLYYNIAKLHLFQFIPEIRFNLPNEFYLKLNFIKPQENIYFRLADKLELNNQIKTCTEFLEIDYVSKHKKFDILSDYKCKKTLIKMIVSDYLPLGCVFNYSNINLTSKNYFRKNKKNLLALLEIIKLLMRLPYRDSFRINIISRINNLLELIPSTNNNLIGSLLERINVYELLKFKNCGLIINQKFLKIYRNFICDLPIKHRCKTILSCFFVSIPLNIDTTQDINQKLMTFSKKSCFATFNNDKKLESLNNLFCNCTFCKIYFMNLNPTIQRSNKLPVIVSDTSEKENYLKTITFPFRIIREIPINISFNVCNIKADRLKSNKLSNLNVNLYIQIPRTLCFSLLSDESKYFYRKTNNNIEKYSNVLEQLNCMNFSSKKPVEIHLGSTFRSSKFNIRNNFKKDPIEVMSTELKFSTRDVRIFPICNKVQRITLRQSIPVIYNHPLASPVLIFASIKDYKFGFMDILSNINHLEIYPDEMRLT
ncbi:hypothetical protein FG386_000460 [Cryptosporidium ryanae]|uniref:uncharacterized protein n=1 Tax=Cryptosporidium ryanae TaxID=515981 RepID=UPI00351AAFFD|nr:hypothetical protein FG386_000460 [Cryptosporidium ryanae]